MGEMILKKAGHRRVDKVAITESDINIIPSSLGDTGISRNEKKLPNCTDSADVDGHGEKIACKRLIVNTPEETNLKQNGAKVRKESEDQKTRDCIRPQGELSKRNLCIEGTVYADVFSSMKVIVKKYAAMNKDAGDVTPFQRPSEKDF